MFVNMSIDILHDRLATLQETTNQLKQLIDRLAGHNFGADSDSLESQDGTASTAELSGEIGQMIREEEEELELLQEEALDLRSGRPGSEMEHQRLRLKEGVARLELELQSHRTNFRKAQVAAKRRLLDAQRTERELLLQSYDEPAETAEHDTTPPTEANTQRSATHPEAPRYHRQTAEPSLLSQEDQRNVSASSNVTQALREMHEMMTTELSKSEFARETLEDSTRMMKSLGESYDSLDGMVAASVGLVGVLMRSQKSDTWYLKTSFYVLAATLGWLIFRRWLYGPLWWLVWLPLRLLLGVSLKTGKSIVSSSSGHDAASSLRSGTTAVIDHVREVEGLPDEETLPTLDVSGASDGIESERVENAIKDEPLVVLEEAVDHHDPQIPVMGEAQEKDEL
jgi:protein transport protein SEC20